MNLIKNPILIESKSTSGNRNTFVLKNESAPGVQLRLGDVFNYLPHGVVVKSETGMGATTLEIMAERNSIIVEPLRFTAQSKSDKKPEYLFVGTRMDKKSATSESEIIRYLRNPAIPKKKIICVVDSLPKLMNSIVAAGLLHSDFFLMLDETDTLQLDSTYRKAMNEAFEIYKNFPPENRATVTATPLQFSDPDLASEAVTEFLYETSVPRDLTLVLTTNYKAQVYEEIVKIITQHPGQKIFIALNLIPDIMEIADQLEKEKIAKPEDIRVLCSSSSRSKVRSRFSNIADEKLPGLINFVTSAYFTGFDLNESYHLIAAICAGSKTMELSEMRYKQIAGRCRTKLLTEMIVYQGEGQSAGVFYDFPSLSSMADEELKALACIAGHYSSGQEYLRDHMMKIRSEILHNASEDRYPLVFENSKKELTKAFATIDSILESTRLRQNIYSVVGGMKRHLEDLGFNVSEVNMTPTTDIATSTSLSRNERNSLEDIEDVLSMYINHGIPFDPYSFFGLTKEVLSIFQEYETMIDQRYLMNKLTTGHGGSKGGTRRINNLKQELKFATTPDDEPLKYHIKANLKVGKKYKKADITRVMTKALAHISNTVSEDQAWLYTRRVFVLKNRGNSNHEIINWVIDPAKVKSLNDVAN